MQPYHQRGRGGIANIPDDKNGGRKYAKAIAITAAVALVCVFSIAYAIDQNNRYGTVPCSTQQADIENDSNRAFATMWEGYSTLKELAGDSDVIVIGRVIDCVKIHSHPSDKLLRLTDFEVAIEKPVEGSPQAGDSLTVQLLTSGSAADYHLMNAGERYVLFLAYNDVTESYAPMGGPQGRYLIEEGDFVYSLDNYYSDVNFISIKAEGKPLDEFLSEVESALE